MPGPAPEHPHGAGAAFGGLQGCSWARLHKQGALEPGLCRHTPARSIIARPSQTRRARLSPATPPAPSPGIPTEQSPSSSGNPGIPSPALNLPWRFIPGRMKAALPAASPAAARWVSQLGYLQLRHTSRDTASQTPKQLSQLPSLVVFPCNVSPGSLPMTSLLHIPSPGRAEGTAGTPRISRAHYTQFNHCEGCGRLAWIRRAC